MHYNYLSLLHTLRNRLKNAHDFFTVTIHKLKVHLQCPLPFPSRPGQFPSFWLAPWMKFLQGRSSSFLPCTRRSVLACLPHWSQWMANASCRTVLQGHQNDDQSDVWHLQHTNIHAGGRKKKKDCWILPTMNLWLKGLQFEAQQVQIFLRIDFICCRVSLPTPPSCYRRNAGVRLQLNTHAPCIRGFKWSRMVIWCAKNVHQNGTSFIWH